MISRDETQRGTSSRSLRCKVYHMGMRLRIGIRFPLCKAKRGYSDVRHTPAPIKPISEDTVSHPSLNSTLKTKNSKLFTRPGSSMEPKKRHLLSPTSTNPAFSLHGPHSP